MTSTPGKKSCLINHRNQFVYIDGLTTVNVFSYQILASHCGWKILGNFNQALAFIPYGDLRRMVWGNDPVKCLAHTSISNPWGSVNGLRSY